MADRPGKASPRYVCQLALRKLQPFAYATAMRLRQMRNDGEIEAPAPFDSRILYQHMPRKGRDGFLFHRDHDAIDQLSATIRLHPRQIGVWTDAFAARRAWCERNDAAMRVLIIPEKHVVYEEKLPRFIGVSPRRPAMQLLGALDEATCRRTLYPLEALKAASLARPTYFKTDTHWNAHGAFVAYEALVESLREEIDLEVVHEADLEFKQRPFVGDLGVRFGEERGETRDALVASKSYKLAYQNHNFGRGAVHVYQNVRRDLPTCVLFRDSFSNYLIPYLMHGFSTLVAVSSLSCHYDLLEQQRPDVVLFVAIERFIATFGRGQTIELPQDAERQPFLEFSGSRLDEIALDQRVYQANFEALSSDRMPPLVLGSAADVALQLQRVTANDVA